MSLHCWTRRSWRFLAASSIFRSWVLGRFGMTGPEPKASSLLSSGSVPSVAAWRRAGCFWSRKLSSTCARLCRRCQRFAVDVGAVAGGELYLGMPPQPGDEALLRAFGQQVHHPPLLEVNEDRAVCVPPPEGEVVHAEHLGFAGARQRGTLRHPEQDVPADHEPELRGKPGAGAPAQPQHDREHGLLQQPLAEDPPLARGLVAEEAADMDIEFHGDAVPG